MIPLLLLTGASLAFPGCASTDSPVASQAIILTDEQIRDSVDRLTGNLVAMQLACLNENVTEGWFSNGLVIKTLELDTGQKYQMILTAGHSTPDTGKFYDEKDKLVNCEGEGGYEVALYNTIAYVQKGIAMPERRGLVYWHDSSFRDLGVFFVPHTDTFAGVGTDMITDTHCGEKTDIFSYSSYGNTIALQILELDNKWRLAKDIVASEDSALPDMSESQLQSTYMTEHDVPDGGYSGRSGSPVIDRETLQVCGVLTRSVSNDPDTPQIFDKILEEYLGGPTGELKTFLDEAEAAFVASR